MSAHVHVERPARPDLFEPLRCPECGGRLEAGQALRCPEHGSFPLRGGIPSFLEAGEFDGHWTDREEAIPASKLATARAFLEPLTPLLERGGARILDVGCGDGVHATLLRERWGDAVQGAGMDASLVALARTRARVGDDWLLVQGDALRPPLAEDYYDAAFAYGVLGYTLDPRRGLIQMARRVKPGGLVGVFLNPRHAGLAGLLYGCARTVCAATGKTGTRALCHLLVPFLGLMPTSSRANLRNASWKQCLEVLEVNLAPERLVSPSREEALGWFADAGLDLVWEDPVTPTTLWGVKADRKHTERS